MTRCENQGCYILSPLQCDPHPVLGADSQSNVHLGHFARHGVPAKVLHKAGEDQGAFHQRKLTPDAQPLPGLQGIQASLWRAAEASAENQR